MVSPLVPASGLVVIRSQMMLSHFTARRLHGVGEHLL